MVSIFLTTVLININFSSLNLTEVPPPTKLKVKLSDKVKNLQGCLARLYILQSESFDNYPYWISHDETQAIWWQKKFG